MNITIQQNRFSLRSEYEITTPGCIYYAEKKLFSWKDKIKLQAPDGGIRARITSRSSWFRSKYDFELQGGNTYHYQCEKFWKGVFVCANDTESYHLYSHKGLNYSIFQNDDQIAAFAKNSVTVGNGDQYEIRMNDDANMVLIICIALTVDDSESENHSSTVTYDFGKIGPEERPFDESWEPS